MTKGLTIRISPDGSVEVVPSGFSGEGCLAAVKPFEELGEVTGERDLPARFEATGREAQKETQ